MVYALLFLVLYRFRNAALDLVAMAPKSAYGQEGGAHTHGNQVAPNETRGLHVCFLHKPLSCFGYSETMLRIEMVREQP